MAPSPTTAPSSAGSSANGDEFPPKLATSLPQLRQQENGDDHKNGKADKGGLGDTLDLAVSCVKTPSSSFHLLTIFPPTFPFSLSLFSLIFH